MIINAYIICMYNYVHAIHGFVMNLWISMDNTKEKDRQRASNCCFPNLPIYCCISTSSTSTYQYLLW